MENKLLSLKSLVDLPYNSITNHDGQYNDCVIQGGIIENSKLCWIASGPLLEIICIKTGRKIAAWKFGSFFKNQYTCVTTVCEIPISDEIGSNLLAIGLEQGTNDGVVCIFTTQGCRILSSINIGEPVSIICLVDAGGNLTGPLSAFDGVLAVATNSGNIYLIDICKRVFIDGLLLGPEYVFDETHLRHCLKTRPKPNANYELLREMSQAKDEHIALNIYSIDILGPVTCMLMITQISALAIGSSTGAFAIIDLIEFKILYKSKSIYGNIHHIAFQEPSDDPRAHCFLWVLHTGGSNILANLHRLIFRSKESIDLCSFTYQDFLSCHLQYSMTLCQLESRLVSCQVVRRIFQDECTISLCMFTWITENISYLCIFDIDQWYKTGMGGNISTSGNELENIVYIKHIIKLDTDLSQCIDIKLDSNSISAFKSCQTYEEYFQPGSLSFDCNVLTISKSFCLHWPGFQMNILQNLIKAGSSGLIAPEHIYLECISGRLIPAFHDNSFNCETSLTEQREMLLSVALDYGYISFLQNCAIAWADGSHAGSEGGPTLYTMVDWIWKQTVRIKNKSNALCTQLFDNSGIPLDKGSQKQFTHCLTQFHMLSTIMQSIVDLSKDWLPIIAYNTVCAKKKALELLSQYYDIVQFLLNLGLLPEVSAKNTVHFTDGKQHIPYPAHIIKQFYCQRRSELSVHSENQKNWGCKILFVDAFIEYECSGSDLRSVWLHDSGSPFYPPISLQALLWVYLQPDVKLENKHILFMYTLLDIASVLDKDKYSKAITQMMQFSDIFKVNNLVTKNTRAFWHLDQKEFQPILDMIANPVNRADGVSHWQHNLLLSSLVSQEAYSEALQVLRLPGPSVAPELKIKILLENHLLSEAFECQRIWGGKKLLQLFFEGCIKFGNISSVMGLSLNHSEEHELSIFLQNSISNKADNLRVLYYLQRSRFAEAISVNKNLHNQKSQHSPSKIISTREMIINAFQNTLPEVMTKLTEYCNNEKKLFEKIKHLENPTPLSVSIASMPTKELQSRSSSLLAFVEKSNEICNTNYTSKKISGVEDMPFLRTPKTKLCNGKEDSLLVYPKSNDYENIIHDQLANGSLESPAKRQKIDSNKSKNKSHKEKNLTHRLLRLNSTPYNFDKLVNLSIQSENLSESNDSVSTLSSPSNKSYISSLVNTPLIKRKKNNSIDNYENDCSAVKRHSILKISNKSITKHLSNLSQESDNSRSIHFAEDDESINSSDAEVNDVDDVPDHNSRHVLFDVKSRQSLRRSNSSAEKSKTIVTTCSTSTAEEIFYSLSSNGTNEKGKDSTVSCNHKELINDIDMNSEESDQSEQSEKPISNSSSDAEFDAKCKEIVKSGPRCRKSLRLSKINDSLRKLSTPSPIGKAKTKAVENRSQKLADLIVTEKKSLARVVLENNACKLQESLSKRTKGPKARDPIHSAACSQMNSKLQNYSIYEASQNLVKKNKLQSGDIYNDYSEIDIKKNDMANSSLNILENQGCRNDNFHSSHDKSKLNENFAQGDVICNKTDSIYNDVYCEDKLECNDLYRDMMLDINEPMKQNNQNFDYADVEPMQNCPEIFLCDEKNNEVQICYEQKQKSDGCQETIKSNIDYNQEHLDDTQEFTDDQQHIVIQETELKLINESKNKHEKSVSFVDKKSEHNVINESQNKNKKNIEFMKKLNECILTNESHSKNENYVTEIDKNDKHNINIEQAIHEEISKNYVSKSVDESVHEDFGKASDQVIENEPETILIDTSDSDSVEEHNRGVLDLNESSGSLCISESVEEEEDEYEKNYSEEEDIKSVEKNILGITEFEEQFLSDRESEDALEIVESETEDRQMVLEDRQVAQDRKTYQQTQENEIILEDDSVKMGVGQDVEEIEMKSNEEQIGGVNEEGVLEETDVFNECLYNTNMQMEEKEDNLDSHSQVSSQANVTSDDQSSNDETINTNSMENQIYNNNISEAEEDQEYVIDTNNQAIILNDSELPELSIKENTADNKQIEGIAQTYETSVDDDANNQAIILNDSELSELSIKGNTAESKSIEGRVRIDANNQAIILNNSELPNLSINENSADNKPIEEIAQTYETSVDDDANDSELPKLLVKENTLDNKPTEGIVLNDNKIGESNLNNEGLKKQTDNQNKTTGSENNSEQSEQVCQGATELSNIISDCAENVVNDTDNITIDSANITDDLSMVEDDEVFVSFENKSHQSEVKTNVETDNKVESALKHKVSTCIIEKTVYEVNNCSVNDILNMTNTPILIPSSYHDETDIFDKSIICPPQKLSESKNAAEENTDQTIGQVQELSTPNKTKPRRSRRLSAVTQNDLIEADDCDNSSVGSGMSVRSTRSRTRRLSMDLETPNENTPRRSSRIRSAETSPVSDVDSVTKSRGGIKKNVDSSPSVSSPYVPKSGTKGRRRSLLATLSEPVIMEENTSETSENPSIFKQNLSQTDVDSSKADQVEKYSKGRRLTRNQRSVLMRSLSSTEQVEPALVTVQELPATPKRRRNSKSSEPSESGDDTRTHGTENSPTNSETSSAQSRRRGAFLKAQSNMKITPSTGTKRTRRNSTQKKTYDSDDGDTSVKSGDEYKFSMPAELNTTMEHDDSLPIDALDTSQEDPFHFSPPKRIMLSTIQEEESVLCHSTEKSEQNQEINVDTELQKGGTATKKGRPRKNSQTTPSTRSSSRIGTRSSKM